MHSRQQKRLCVRANKQGIGKWEMHDRLFKNQQALAVG